MPTVRLHLQDPNLKPLRGVWLVDIALESGGAFPATASSTSIQNHTLHQVPKHSAIDVQGARLVDIALESGGAFSGKGFQYIKPALEEHTLHFIGLLSDGGEP